MLVLMPCPFRRQEGAGTASSKLQAAGSKLSSGAPLQVGSRPQPFAYRPIACTRPPRPHACFSLRSAGQRQCLACACAVHSKQLEGVQVRADDSAAHGRWASVEVCQAARISSHLGR